ncbi:hypothetical protein HMPREF6485_2558 [Segatella buccae ATCC 33574]|uniref:Uncharacterized protein n=1 Tax=Segatella buccae ATCC 33574 TaxID=873513 RepID=E6KAC2_9BACT|nr:hypothetical protein HMPREF6485_2558 [Segatella buccae ATCC 33574]
MGTFSEHFGNLNNRNVSLWEYQRSGREEKNEKSKIIGLNGMILLRFVLLHDK